MNNSSIHTPPVDVNRMHRNDSQTVTIGISLCQAGGGPADLDRQSLVFLFLIPRNRWDDVFAHQQAAEVEIV